MFGRRNVSRDIWRAVVVAGAMVGCSSPQKGGPIGGEPDAEIAAVEEEREAVEQAPRMVADAAPIEASPPDAAPPDASPPDAAPPPKKVTPKKPPPKRPRAEDPPKRPRGRGFLLA